MKAIGIPRDADGFHVLLFIFLCGALVVDDLHMACVNEFYIVLLGPIHAALEDERQEYAGYVQHHLQGVIRELNFIIGAVGGVADGLEGGGYRRSLHLGHG